MSRSRRLKPTVPSSTPPGYERRAIVVRGSGTTRREFLQVLGGGLVVALLARNGFAAPPAAGVALQTGTGPEDAADLGPEQIGAWLQIGEDGAVTVYTGKVEVGQGIRTSLAQMVAEELRVPLASVRLVMGDTDLTPFDLGTFGSRSTPQMGLQLRKVAAAARTILVRLAAEGWRVDQSGLTVANGRVVDPATRRAVPFGKLVMGRRLTDAVRDDVALEPAARWTVAGTAAPKVGGRDVVTGRMLYTSDLRLPGMLYGKVVRPPSVGAHLASVDTTGVSTVPGAVVVHEDDFLGVVAPSRVAAARAAGAIRATWTPGPALPSQRQLFDYLVQTPAVSHAGGPEGGAASPITEGSVERGLAAADQRLTRRYTVAYIAHVPLECRAAVAQWSDGGLTVWTGTQRPFGVREELAAAFGVPEARIRVIVPDTGSAYGGKHSGECAVEAARLARATGRPVKLLWTREEEFRYAYFRPAGVIDVTAGVRRDGAITAWAFDNYNSGGAGIRPVYAIPNQRLEYHPSESPLRQGSYRGLAATANHFARETHLDELAQLVRMDPLAFRLRNLADPRMRAVLQAAAERFGWGSQPPAGHGHGIAAGFEKGSYVATCAEVAVDRASGQVRVVRAVTAFDCGAVVNPDNLRNQIEGAVIQGLGGALFEEIDFADGALTNAALSAYRVPRFADVPRLETVLVDRNDLPSVGAGETPIVAVAPALGSAIFAVTGVRPRSLPMARGGGTTNEGGG